MPCTYTGSIEGDKAYFLEKSNKALGGEVTKLTQLLCSLCKHNEANKQTINSKVKYWWEKHKKLDAKRKKKK